MVNILAAPGQPFPNSATDCLTFCLLPDDYITAAPTRPTVTFNIVSVNVPTYPMQTTILGKVFVTAVSLIWGSAVSVFNQILAGLNSSTNAGTFTGVLTSTVFGGVATITYSEYGVFADMVNVDMGSSIAVQASSIGTDTVVAPNYYLTWALFEKNTFADKLIASFSQTEPNVDANGVVQAICFDFKKSVEAAVYTTIPKIIWLSGSGVNPIYDLTIKKDFYMRYGRVIYAASGKIEDMNTSSSFTAINTAFQETDEVKFLAYSYDALWTPQKFMNARTQESTICRDSHAWLWCYLSSISPSDTYIVNFSFYAENGANIGSFSYAANSPQSVLIIPVGTAQIQTMPIGTYSYKIYVSRGGLLAPLTQYYTITIEECCCCEYELYFLSKAGGYDTINFELAESNLQTEQTEICRDIPCGGLYIDILHGTNRQINTKSKEKITLTTDNYSYSDAQRDFFKDFKESEQRFIRIKDKQGNYQIAAFLIESGDVQILKKGDFITLEVTGWYGFGTKIQSEW